MNNEDRNALPNEITDESGGEASPESNGFVRIPTPVAGPVHDQTHLYSFAPANFLGNGDLSQSDSSEESDAKVNVPLHKERGRPGCKECEQAIYSKRVKRLEKIIKRNDGRNPPRLQRNGIYGVLKR